MRIFDGAKDADLREAGRLLREGGVLAIPTETVYGLAADASNPNATARIYAIKGREGSKALPILVADGDHAAKLCHVSPFARTLMAGWWPGPLTLVMPALEGGTLACRCPNHDAALAVLRYAALPLALTSANRSGEPAPSKVSQISLTGLGGIVDGGPCVLGRASAILDVTCDPPELLRHNAAVIGVTGGSGAGKSLVMERLEELGAAVIRADDVYRSLLAKDASMLAKLRERFPEVFERHGAFERAKMRQVAFSDKKALAELNQITHPYVIAEVRREMARVFLAREGAPIAIEAIGLIGSGLDALCSCKLAVTSPFELRLERIMLRDGLTREDAVKRLQNQKPEEYYITHCDILLENNGTAEELTEGVAQIWEEHMKN